jgi:hypothetical protein
MSLEISKIMEALRERQAKLWELDDEIAAEAVDDFWDGLLAHIDQELTTLAAPGQGPTREEPR